MKSKWVVVLCAMFAVQDVVACGMTSKLVPFSMAEGSPPVDVAGGEIPAPTAVVTELVRGIGPNHSSCDDTGLLTVVVEWPRGGYKLRELGFEFKVVAGSTPYAIFPEGVVQAPISGRSSDFLFMWREGAPAQQQPIDLQVEVRAVTRDNQRGPPARILVRSAPGA
ncbi:hypothetical protein DT603_00330 [Pseudoxanthomonas gei]|uniref:Lipoprotein n=1 Tax=Pseudoxanthomonas gei TaxID=1383030 RepID=A0ABX0AAI0_9GAMM|nr:hypothetical protein [Pseudoxanthomonas gei]NDK37291.1 hypothetical protein [Pseudoxanthomonas gei]